MRHVCSARRLNNFQVSPSFTTDLRRVIKDEFSDDQDKRSRRYLLSSRFVPPGTTVNADFYCDVLRRLREKIRRKRPELWRSGDWFLHHDNAPAHSPIKTLNFFEKTGTNVLPHPPYSPDLAPCHFFLFPKTKLSLKGRRFETIEEIQRESQKVFDSLTEADFHEAFLKWERRWNYCVTSEGQYFEGDTFPK